METMTSEEQIKQALATYNVADAAIVEAKQRAEALEIAGLEDAKGYEVVRSARAEARKMRTSVEKTRKRLKADALAFGRAVDGEAKRLTAQIEPIELELQAKLDAIDEEKERLAREEREREEAFRQARVDALTELGVSLPDARMAASMGPAEYDAKLAEARELHAAEEARKKAEAEEAKRERQRQAEEIAQLAKEQEAAKLEAEALRREREELERQRAELEAERQRAEAEKAKREAELREDEEPKPGSAEWPAPAPADDEPAEEEAPLGGHRLGMTFERHMEAKKADESLAKEAVACLEAYEITGEVEVLISFIEKVARS